MDDPNAIRVCVFLITTITVSLPAVGRALASVCSHTLDGRLSAIPILLLLSDMAELTMTLSVVRSLLGGHTLISLESPLMLLICRLWGMCFHQLVAIEGILHLKKPRSSTGLHSCFCSIGVTTFSLLIVLVFIALPITFFVGLLMLLTFACVYNISKSNQKIVREVGLTMITVCLFTVVFLYSPLVVYMMTHQKPEQALVESDYSDLGVTQWGAMVLAISSLRVLADPALCVLVCRLIPRPLHS